MVDVSGFITFMHDYSKRNNREIEIQFNTDWNKDKGIYVHITNFDEDDEEQYLLNCKITEKGYYFSGVNKWNLEIIEEVLACIKYENRGMFPADIQINGHDYNLCDSFESVTELLDAYNAWGDEDYGDAENEDDYDDFINDEDDED